MEIIRSLEQLHKSPVPCVVAMGTFDGLHLGHQDVIRAAGRRAAETGGRLAVFTFSNHPMTFIRPDQVPASLLTEEQKYACFEKLGVDVLMDIRFDAEVAGLEPEAFLARLQELDYSCLAVGENFTYGRFGHGDVRTLAASASRMGFQLIVRPLVTLEGRVVSSTEIRSLITAGSVELAGRMLGRSYSLTGRVVRGNERGRLLGFPTANMELDSLRAAVPMGGVYAVTVTAGGRKYGGMANIGSNPTFGDVRQPRLETNIFGFSGDLYGSEITVAFRSRIRGETKFSGIEQLKRQLEADRREAGRRLGLQL